MSDRADLTKRVMDALKQDEEQRQDGAKSDPTEDLDEFTRRAFGRD
jgi:hypothetical protein